MASSETSRGVLALLDEPSVKPQVADDPVDMQKRAQPTKRVSRGALRKRADRATKALKHTKKQIKTEKGQQQAFDKMLLGALVMQSKKKGPKILTTEAMMHCASLPTSLSDYHALEIVGHDIKSRATIRKCRRVVATALRKTNAIRVHERLIAAMPPCMQPTVELAGLREGSTLKFEPVESILEPLDADKDMPLVILLKWKFDSTPDKSTFTAKLDDDSDGVEMADSDCFAQQGHCMIADPSSGKVTALAVTTPQRSIPSGSAKNMLGKLDFMPLLAFLEKMTTRASLREVDELKGLPLVIVLSLTTDQHVANLKLVRHLTWRFRTKRKGSPYIVMISSVLCQTHQLSLIARCQYAHIGGFVLHVRLHRLKREWSVSGGRW